LIFHDIVEMGPAVAAKAFDHVSEILLKAQKVLDSCSCADGCGDCILDPSCREGNEIRSKIGASIILKCLLAVPIDPDSIRSADTVQAALHRRPASNTIVKAIPVPTANGVKGTR
jgi:DEAD/DEAH box helicase domain-containing protein